jgi:adenylate cyclase
MAEKRVERRLAAILAGDIAGYSRLMGVDEEGTLARLNAHRREFLEPTIAEHRGRIVKRTGDGILIEFSSAVDAVRCATQQQRGMAQRNIEVPAEQRIELRIGIHVGDIMIEEGDIFGDGVNIAARLEGIAQPGGICISDDAFRQIRGKIDENFKDSGEQDLKNIAAPVRVYQWPPDAAVVANGVSANLTLPEKPSIAVLPFQNISDDPQQEYFADGIVEDIITSLSRIHWFFVIARNSSFTYKGKAVDVRVVGRELGVRYILEGSVRKAGNRLRITTQLVEAATGNHLWAEKFDGALADVFDLQDQITVGVVGAIEPSVRHAEIERARRKRVATYDAYDLYLQALPHVWAHSREKIVKGLDLLNAALQIDPAYAAAHGLAAWAYQQRFLRGGARPEDREAAIRHARTALSLDTDDTTALSLGGSIVTILERDYKAGTAATEKALLYNPNSAQALGFSAFVNALAGRFEPALNRARQSIRLSPFDPVRYVPEIAMCTVLFCTGSYAEAAEAAYRAIEYNPRFLPARAMLAACLVRLGNLEEARTEAKRVLALEPNFRLKASLAPVASGISEVSAPLLDAFKETGLPE